MEEAKPAEDPPTQNTVQASPPQPPPPAAPTPGAPNTAPVPSAPNTALTPPSQQQPPSAAAPSAPNTVPAHPSRQPAPPPTTQSAPPPLPPKSKKRPLDSNVQIQECSYFRMRAVLKDIRPHLLEVLRTADFRNCKEAYEIRGKLKLLMELYKQMTAETVSTTKFKSASEGQTFSGQNGAVRKPQEQPQADRVFAKPAENKTFQSAPGSDKQHAEDAENRGTYIVGGSAFGWNFITFPGNKPTYYGRKKESFRTAQVTL